MKKKNFLQIYKNKKVLITGTTGFKGSWLAFWLNKIGARVYGVSLKEKKKDYIFSALRIEKKIKQYYLDINNFDKINNIIKKIKPEIVFHLAAETVVSDSFNHPLQTFKTNLLGGANVLESCRINKIKNLIFITSDKCYENKRIDKPLTERDRIGGIDPYSASKSGAEIIFHSYVNSFLLNKNFINYGSCRAGNVVGGGDNRENGIISDIVKSIINKKKLTIRNPRHIRPWQHVIDALYSYLLLGEYFIMNKLNKKIYPSWNFGPNYEKSQNVLNLTKLFLKIWGVKKTIIFKKKNFNETKYLILSAEKAKKELKHQNLLNFEENIALTVDWYKNYFFNKQKIEEITLSQIDYFLKKL